MLVLFGLLLVFSFSFSLDPVLQVSELFVGYLICKWVESGINYSPL